MKIKTYNKLVRDNIPEIIREGGGECVTEVLSDGDYLRALDSKLSEEMKEYTDSRDIEELADILEVVYAAAGARGITRDALENIRTEKHRRNGGFSKKLFLSKKQFNDIANKACLKCKQGLVATQLSLSYNSIKCVSI